VITGEVYPHENKPEGPFGDHLGYYSLQHTFPLMRVHKVYAKKDAIWAFTVVGRPPQEDTSFGQLIHEITGDAIPQEIPGLHSVHAVDAAGVHPLLLAVGSERYTPYTPAQQPAELLTIANHILGTGQLSLAKFLFITGSATQKIDAQDTLSFMTYLLERINFTRDIHFHTHTTMDTLDYSGTGINSGSKVVLAAYGDKIRDLSNEVPTVLNKLEGFGAAGLAMPGVVCLTTPSYTNAQDAASQMNALDAQLSNTRLEGIAIIVICDDAGFTAQTLNNYLWVTYTRSNPSHDIYGIGAFTQYKHWGCTGPLVIDARIKPHHAPVLIKDEAVEKRVDQLFEKGGSLYSLISTQV
jgi:4-hydroxy-3-polyprenylbenzoate decarboxylase